MKSKILMLNLFWITVVICSGTMIFLRVRHVYTGYDYYKGQIDGRKEFYDGIMKFNPVRCSFKSYEDPNIILPYKDMIIGVKPSEGNTFQFCIDDYTPVEPETK